MIQTKFDVIDFQKFTPSQWKKRYLSDIRVSVKWDRVKIIETGLVQALPTDELILPWYTGADSWLDGVPRVEHIGTELMVVRIPVVLITKGVFLVLDGCHRLTELRPSIVLLDYIVVENSLKYFVDLRNLEWLKRINPKLK